MINLFRIIYPEKYTSSDPYKKIWVDPNKIEFYTIPTGTRRRGWVVSGDWDLKRARFMNREVPQRVKKYHRKVVNGQDSSDSSTNPTNISDIYHSILRNGYLRQEKLYQLDPDSTWNSLNDVMHPKINEVGVDIGRNGEILWHMCGQHRLAVAKVLDIDKIPVQVYRRHREWEKIRRKAQKHGIDSLPQEFHSHPDLIDTNSNNLKNESKPLSFDYILTFEPFQKLTYLHRKI